MKAIQLLHFDFPVKLEGQKVCLMDGALIQIRQSLNEKWRLPVNLLFCLTLDFPTEKSKLQC